MKSLEALEAEIMKLQARNKRVEADKAWETSLTRRLFISGATYFLIAVFMIVLGVEKPFVSAIIPAIAYLISTASLAALKEVWLAGQKKT